MARSRISTVCFKKLCAYLLQCLSKVQSILNIGLAKKVHLSFFIRYAGKPEQTSANEIYTLKKKKEKIPPKQIKT